ncbi:hypothetical protein [Hyphomicrobium sp. DY-1]|uniref:hypothetical protein n=1 Tax=Hyphomicrobium sp. DY-1 TaxID=3075650 RepID=UPI0039C3510D
MANEGAGITEAWIKQGDCILKNKLIDLNNHLFAQLERLGDENLTADRIDAEVKRTEAIVAVSKEIIANADIALKGARLVAEHGGTIVGHLPATMIEGSKS